MCQVSPETWNPQQKWMLFPLTAWVPLLAWNLRRWRQLLSAWKVLISSTDNIPSFKKFLCFLESFFFFSRSYFWRKYKYPPGWLERQLPALAISTAPTPITLHRASQNPSEGLDSDLWLEAALFRFPGFPQGLSEPQGHRSGCTAVPWRNQEVGGHQKCPGCPEPRTRGYPKRVPHSHGQTSLCLLSWREGPASPPPTSQGTISVIPNLCRCVRRSQWPSWRPSSSPSGHWPAGGDWEELPRPAASHPPSLHSSFP